jgi:CheY-like chemotaxis protein
MAMPALPNLRGIRILLAEDNKTNQMVATQMLQSMNAEVTVASDGYEALLKFENGNFDLALLDIEMPRMSGLDVLRAIRARTDERANTPLVALTAYAMREHKERIAAAGANGLIPKPLISIESFGQALMDYLSIDRRPSGAAATNALAEPARDSAELIDMQIYDSLLSTIGPDSMGELLEKVVEDVAGVKSGLVEGTANADHQLIRSNTHILISVAGAIGATSLQVLAERLNAAAHGGNETSIADLGDQCIAGISAAEIFLGQEQERFRL